MNTPAVTTRLTESTLDKRLTVLPYVPLGLLVWKVIEGRPEAE